MSSEKLLIIGTIYALLMVIWLGKILQQMKEKRKKNVFVLFALLVAIIYLLYEFVKKKLLIFN